MMNKGWTIRTTSSLPVTMAKAAVAAIVGQIRRPASGNSTSNRCHNQSLHLLAPAGADRILHFPCAHITPPKPIMATQVPQTNTPLPTGRRPEQASPSLEKPIDYRETFKVRPAPSILPADVSRADAQNRSAHTKVCPCSMMHGSS